MGAAQAPQAVAFPISFSRHYIATITYAGQGIPGGGIAYNPDNLAQISVWSGEQWLKVYIAIGQ